MADKASILKDLDDGMTVAEVAEKHSLSEPRIYQIKAERKNPPVPKPRPRKANYAKLIADIRSGVLPSAAGAKHGLTKGRVSQILAEHDPGAAAAGDAARAVIEQEVLPKRIAVVEAWNTGAAVPIIVKQTKSRGAFVYESVALLGGEKRPATAQAVKEADHYGAETGHLRVCFGVSRQRLHQLRHG